MAFAEEGKIFSPAPEYEIFLKNLFYYESTRAPRAIYIFNETYSARNIFLIRGIGDALTDRVTKQHNKPTILVRH